MLNLGQNQRFFCPVWLCNLMKDLEKEESTPPILHWSLCIISKPSVNSNWGYSPETFNSDHNRRFLSRVSLKFYGWSWKIILHESLRIVSKPSVNSNWSYSPETPNWACDPCDFEICQMTLKNIRASLLCCFKLFASFRSHWWIQTVVTVQKRPIWVKIDDFLAVWP